MTGEQPARTAPATADSPTPPTPKITKLCPGRAPAVFHTEPTPVGTAQPKSAACAMSMPSGNGVKRFSLMTAYRLNVVIEPAFTLRPRHSYCVPSTLMPEPLIHDRITFCSG